jgi:hypothetical protein
MAEYPLLAQSGHATPLTRIETLMPSFLGRLVLRITENGGKN